MKILFLCSEHPGNIAGGMGEACAYLAKEIGTNTRLDYVSFAEGPELDVPYKIHVANCGPVGPRPPGMPTFIENQTSFFTEAVNAYDGHEIVHAHDWVTTQIAHKLKYLYPNIKIVHTWHLYQHHNWRMEGESKVPTIEAAVAEYMEMYGLQQADKNVVCSQQMHDYTKEGFGFQGHVQVIRNGIDYDKWSNIAFDKSLRNEFPKDKMLLLFNSRVATQKGVKFIYDMIMECDDFHVMMMCRFFDETGGIPTSDHRNIAMFTELRDKHPDRITFTGFKHGDDRLPYMSICDAVIMPSISEPFGLAGLETLAAGKPLVTTAVEGMREFCNDDTAWIMEQSTQSMVDTLKTVDGSKKAAGQDMAQTFSWSRAGQKYIELYKELLNGV